MGDAERFGVIKPVGANRRALTQHSAVRGAAEDDLLVLAGSVTTRSFKAGQLIFNQGDAGSEMFIVADGHVNIHLPGEASRRVSLKDIARGEYFGELALFDDKPRSASALATTDALLLELDHATRSSAYLERRPRAAMAILRTMAERLRETNAMLSQRAAKNVVKEIERTSPGARGSPTRSPSSTAAGRSSSSCSGLTLAWTVVNTRARSKTRSTRTRSCSSTCSRDPRRAAGPAHRHEPEPVSR